MDTVPDLHHPQKPMKKDFFRTVHVFYFNKISLRNVLEKNNLDIKEIVEKPKSHELYVIAKLGKIKNRKIKKENYKLIQKELKKNSKFDNLYFCKVEFIDILVWCMKNIKLYDFFKSLYVKVKK